MNDFKFDLQAHATAIDSNPDDLMLGAGSPYFERFNVDGTPSGKLYCLGNTDEMVLTTDITKVEKNSSMNKAREQMASVVTAVKPKLVFTLTEYDPQNVALGIFGEKGILTQVASTITDREFTVSPDSIIRLIDPVTKQNFYNISDVVVKPQGSLVPVLGAVTKQTVLASDGTITVSGTYTGTGTKTYYLKVKTAPTAAGDVAGLELSYDTQLAGLFSNSITFTSGSTETKVLAEGISVTVNLATTKNFIVNEIYQFTATAAVAAYVEGVDYIINDLDARAGMIRFPETSSVGKDAVVLVSATVPAGVYPKVIGGNAGSIKGRVLFIGDPNLGPCYNGEFWKVSITPDGDLTGLIGTDFGSYKITADILSDRKNHPDNPMYELVKVASAI